MSLLNVLLVKLLCLFPCSGPGSFDSVGGTYDEQTGFGFDTQMYYEARTRTFIGSLSKGKNVDTMIAGGEDGSIDGSAVIRRKKIDQGDMLRSTMQEHMTGMPSWGDIQTQIGNYLGYKNQEHRVNLIKSPAIPIQGEMNRQRVAHSIKDIPGSVRNEVLDYMAEEMEFEAIIALLYGGSKSVLKPTSEGGLGISLGVGAGGGAGIPLLMKNFYCVDQGFPTYSDVPATWNSAVNGYINAITASADSLTALKIKVIRRQMDRLHFAPVYLNGKKYRAIALTDPDLWYRLDHLLKSDYTYARERGDDNPIFGVDHKLVYQGILFLNVPNLEKFRAGYSASLGYPTIGPGLSTDPRTYTTSSSVAWILFCGAGALLEGYNDSIKIVKATAPFGEQDGLYIGAHMKDGFLRGEWYAKDGRASSADNVYCNNFMAAAFYETGVNSLT